MHLEKVLEKRSVYLLVNNSINTPEALFLKCLHFLSRQLALEKQEKEERQTETSPSKIRLCI